MHSHCSFFPLPCGGRCRRLRGPLHWTPHLTPAPKTHEAQISQILERRTFCRSVSEIIRRKLVNSHKYFTLRFDGSPCCRLPASVPCCETCECLLSWCESSSRPRQLGSANHIAAHGAGAPPRCCDWSPGHPATRSRCPSPSTCRWTAWTFWIWRREEQERSHRKRETCTDGQMEMFK